MKYKTQEEIENQLRKDYLNTLTIVEVLVIVFAVVTIGSMVLAFVGVL